MKKVVSKFWKEWEDANELEKPKIIERIVDYTKMMDYSSANNKSAFCKFLNSYFLDLHEYLKQKR